MATWTVEWFNDSMGYSSVTTDDGWEASVAHFSAIQINRSKTLIVGRKLSLR